MGLFKTLFYVCLGTKCLEKVVDEFQRATSKETVYIVYTDAKNDDKKATKKEKFKTKKIEKENQ